MEGFRTGGGEARTRSNQTRADSSSLPDRQEPYSISNNMGQRYRMKDPLPTEWTDEKHCQYLKSMEASFVNDLYSSLDILGLRSPAEKLSDPQSSQKMHLNTRTTPGQFKVFRGAIWQKINFDKPEAHVEKSNGSRMLVGNSWTPHVRSSCRQVRQCLAHEDSSEAESQKVNLRGGKITTRGFTVSKFHPLGHGLVQRQGSVDTCTEVSDQNFISEDIEGENVGAKSSENKIKAVAADTSSDDQVVPCGNLTVPGDVDRNCVTSGKTNIQQ